VTGIDHTYWYLSRAAGLVAYVLLFVSVSLGLTMTGGVLERVLRRYRIYDIHRFVSLVTLGLSLFHVLILLGDDYIGFSVVELLVPFASPYRPLYTALGALALYMTAIIVGTFYVRRLVPYRAWRLIHYTTFAVFVLTLVHAVGAGTDTSGIGFQYMYAATAVIAFNLLVYRVLKGETRGIRANPVQATSRPAPVARARDRG